jgi:chromate transport protein ChrA
MIRILLTVVLPFVLPTLLYVVWISTMRHAAPATPAPRPALPWVWLVAAGVLLTALLLFLVNLRLGTSDGTYVPPHFIDGRVVPGEVVPRDAAKRPP